MRGEWVSRCVVARSVWLLALGVIASRQLFRRRRERVSLSIGSARKESQTRREASEVAIPQRTRVDTIVAIGGLVTGFAAVMGLVFSSFTLTMQRQQMAADQERQEIAYAERFTYWWQEGDEGVELFLLNANSTPMPAWIVLLPEDAGYDGPARPPGPFGAGIGTLAASDGAALAGSVERNYRFIGNVPPCTQIRAQDPLGNVDVDRGANYVIGSLLFVDPAGNFWRRSLDGELERLIERPPDLERDLLLSVILSDAGVPGLISSYADIAIERAPVCDVPN